MTSSPLGSAPCVDESVDLYCALVILELFVCHICSPRFRVHSHLDAPRSRSDAIGLDKKKKTTLFQDSSTGPYKLSWLGACQLLGVIAGRASLHDEQECAS